MSNDNNAALRKLLTKREQLEQRIKTLKARERRAAKKTDTRRKMIIGTAVDEYASMHPLSPFALELKKLLDRCVTKPQDRAALGLPLPQISENKEGRTQS